MIVHDISNKKLKKLYPDLNFISPLVRNKSDLKLKTLFLICGTLLYVTVDASQPQTTLIRGKVRTLSP